MNLHHIAVDELKILVEEFKIPCENIKRHLIVTINTRFNIPNEIISI